MSKNELIVWELKQIARSGQKMINIQQFYQLARKNGLVRGQLIKEHLLTIMAQGYLTEKNPRIYELNADVLGVEPREAGKGAVVDDETKPL